MAAIPSRANIVNASFSVIVWALFISSLLPPRFGITVYLKARSAQAVDTVPVDVALPGQELIDRKFVEPAYLLDWHPAPAYGVDHGRLASNRPPLPGPGQLGHLAQYIVQAGVSRRTYVPEESE
jgi:hypothetical protein